MSNARARFLSRRLKLIDDIKSEQGCKQCGIRDPQVLDFHHRDPNTKRYAISKIRTHAKKTLLEEIAKCDVYCANCHHILELEQGVYQSGTLIRTRREQMRKWLDGLKTECGCGESDPRVLRFVGSNPSVQQMWHKGWGKERILAAIEECELLCLNCIRKRND